MRLPTFFGYLTRSCYPVRRFSGGRCGKTLSLPLTAQTHFKEAKIEMADRLCVVILWCVQHYILKEHVQERFYKDAVLKAFTFYNVHVKACINVYIYL